MANERIDIEIVDKVSPAIGQKLEKIAAAAREANAHIVNLQKALSAVKPAQINNLATAETKAAIAAKKLEQSTASAATAQQRLATEVQRTAAAESKAISATVKLETEQKKLAAQTQKTAAAQSRAEQAALRLKNAQDKAAKSASQSSFSFGAMKGPLIGVTAAVGSLWAALSIADEFANLENRLRSTGLEGEGLNDVMRKLTDSANNTRSSLAGTVELYSRLAVSSSELGVTQEQLIGFTTSLNQAILLSGANAAEAQAGLIQLSQGMASGTLRGDELRSVLEQLPAVADVIAKSLGVTRGQLRQLGADGKISAQTILKAFQEAGPELERRFSDLDITAGQALTVLKNNIMELSGTEGKGALDQVSGAIMDLNNSLTRLGENNGLSVLGGVLSSIMKELRVFAATIESVFTWILPSVLSSFGKVMNQMLQNLSKLFNYIAPDSLAQGFEKYVQENAKFWADMGTSSQKGFEDLLGVIEKTYAAEVPQASVDQKAIDAYKLAAAKRRAEEKKKAEEAKRKAEEAKRKAEYALLHAREFDTRYLGQVEKIADAYSEITTELDRMQSSLGKTDKELAIQNKMLEFAAKMEPTKGSALDLAEMEKRLRLLTKQTEAWERQKQILESVKRTDFNTAMSDLASLGSRISPEQRQDYLISQNADLFAGTAEAIQANLKNYEDMYARINAMREADDISQTTASQMRLKVWIAENEAKLQTASEFFNGFAALQTSTWSELAAVGKAAAIAQATIDGILAVQKALAAYPPPVSYAMAASAGVAAAVNVAKIQGVAGFETGGYTGNVGTSSVAGVVHGQEYVMDADTVRRVGVDSLDAIRSGAAMIQQPAGPVIGSGNQNQTQNVNQTRIVNVIDPALVGDWMNTPDGERAILNIIRNNADTMRQTVNG